MPDTAKTEKLCRERRQRTAIRRYAAGRDRPHAAADRIRGVPHRRIIPAPANDDRPALPHWENAASTGARSSPVGADRLSGRSGGPDAGSDTQAVECTFDVERLPELQAWQFDEACATSLRSERAMISPAQLRAARALLDWTRADFGTAAGISPETIRNIETARFEPAAETVRKITLAFAEKASGFLTFRRASVCLACFCASRATTTILPPPSSRRARHLHLPIAWPTRSPTGCASTANAARATSKKWVSAAQEIAEAWSLASALAAVEGPGR